MRRYPDFKWPDSSGISGRNGVEYALAIKFIKSRWICLEASS